MAVFARASKAASVPRTSRSRSHYDSTGNDSEALAMTGPRWCFQNHPPYAANP